VLFWSAIDILNWQRHTLNGRNVATLEDILVPDIGDFAGVEVIEILVKPGDRIEAEQSLLTLESDKSTMEIPASKAGVVRDIKIRIGDKIATGDQILTLEVSDVDDPILRLQDKALLIARTYVADNFYWVDDFWRRSPRSSDEREKNEESFEKMVAFTESDIRKCEYRRAFCRLICWAGTAPGKILHPFSYGGKTVTRRLHEAFCAILMRMGSLEDSVEAAVEFSSVLAPADLVPRIDEAITSRKRGAGDTLLGILVALEPGHPQIDRLRDSLLRLMKIAQLQESNIVDVDLIDSMSGMDFEHLVASMFEKLGFRAEATPRTGDYGADLIVVSPNRTRISVQCKRFKTKVNLQAVQEVVASLSHYQCDFGVVITNNDFLNSAKRLASSNEVELWDKDCLINFLSGDISFSELQRL
jgi:hypothetical protein